MFFGYSEQMAFSGLMLRTAGPVVHENHRYLDNWYLQMIAK